MRTREFIRISMLAFLLLGYCSCALKQDLHEVGGWSSSPDSVRSRLAKAYKAHPDAGTVLNLVLTDWLTDPKHKEYALSYVNYEGDRGGALKSVLIDSRFTPGGFRPRIPDVPVSLYDRSKHPLEPGEIGIRFDKFDSQEDGMIKVEFVNAGWGIIGGAWVTYNVRKTDKGSNIVLIMVFDP